MPAIRGAGGRNRKPPPDGFEDIEDTLLEFANKMKDAEAAPHEGKKRQETLWPIFQITHQRTYHSAARQQCSRSCSSYYRTTPLTSVRRVAGSRYIYDLYYKREGISKALYDWLLKNNYADATLIAKWKKQGYEQLCCLRCIQTKETNFNSTCICRVPRHNMKEGQTVECVSCGCRGCASGD